MRYSKKRLKNGITLINISGLQTQASTVAIYVKGGFRFDPHDKPGLSHFTEHMIFNIDNSPKFKKMVEKVESSGGWRSAFTWIEQQEHMIHLPSNNFGNGINLALKSILEPLIENSEINKERGIVKEEILRNKSDPSRAMWDFIWLPLFFQGTHISRPYSGSIQDIENITIRDLKEFHSKLFQTNNIIVFVSGDIEDSYVQELVEEYTSGRKKPALIKKQTALSPLHRKNILVYEDRSYYQTTIAIGIKTVPFNSSQRYIFDILLDMLGGYFSTPLIRALRDEGGLVYSWNTYQENLSDIGYLMFNISVVHENVNKVISIVLNEFKRFAKNEFFNTEIEMAKNHLTGSILANMETGRDYISWYSMQELLDPNNVMSVDDKIHIYKNLKDEEIRQIASEHFVTDKILIGAIGKTTEAQISKLL